MMDADRPCGCKYDADGLAEPCADHRPQDKPRKLHCATCGVRGHNARTCGLTDDQRRANRRGKP